MRLSLSAIVSRVCDDKRWAAPNLCRSMISRVTGEVLAALEKDGTVAPLLRDTAAAAAVDEIFRFAAEPNRWRGLCDSAMLTHSSSSRRVLKSTKVKC